MELTRNSGLPKPGATELHMHREDKTPCRGCDRREPRAKASEWKKEIKGGCNPFRHGLRRKFVVDIREKTGRHLGESTVGLTSKQSRGHVRRSRREELGVTAKIPEARGKGGSVAQMAGLCKEEKQGEE